MKKSLITITAGVITEFIGGIADVFRHLDRPFETGWEDFLSATSHQIIGLGFVIIVIGGIGAWRAWKNVQRRIKQITSNETFT